MEVKDCFNTTSASGNDSFVGENNQISANDQVVANEAEDQDEQSFFDPYNQKIEEFTLAIQKRDSLIEQLQGKLGECMHQREILSTEVEIQSKGFTKEIESLKQQLQESMILLEKQNRAGVNMKEHLELKTKLMVIQEDRAEDKKVLEDINNQLKFKTESYSDLEQKYKLLVQTQKEAARKYLIEVADQKELFEHAQNEHVAQLNHFIKENERNLMELEKRIKLTADQEINDIKNSFSEQVNFLNFELSSSKEQIAHLQQEAEEERLKSTAEVRDLMIKFEKLNQQLEISTKEKDDQQKKEEKIKNVSRELRKRYEGELEKVALLHKEEVSLISQHIEQLEKNGKEDQTKLLESLQLMNNECLKYKQELLDERDKCAKLKDELEETQNVVVCLETKYTQVEDLLKSKIEELEGRKNLEEKLSSLQKELEDLSRINVAKESEISNLAEELQSEKELKNQLNLKLKEMELNNECISNQFKENLSEIEKISNDKQILQTDNENLRDTLKSEMDKIDALTKELFNVRKNLASKDSLEVELKVMTDKLKSLQSYASDLEQYKCKCHEINEKIKCLNKALLEKWREEYSMEDEDLLEDMKNESGNEDQLSMLTSRVMSLTEKLEETQSVTQEFHVVLEQNISLKNKISELDQQLTGQLNARELLAQETDCASASERSKAYHLNDDKITKGIRQSLNKDENISMRVNEDTSMCATSKNVDVTPISNVLLQQEKMDSQVCVACQTLISTQEQGFQTSIPKYSSSAFATKTIEEDYMMEEIFIIPKKIPLPSICITGNTMKGIAAPLESYHTICFESTEELQDKYQEAQSIIKSLENENMRLKCALQFKIGGSKETQKQKTLKAPELSQQLRIADSEFNEQERQIEDVENALQLLRNKETVDHSTNLPSEGISRHRLYVLKNILLGVAEEKLTLLKKQDELVKVVRSQQEEISKLNGEALEQKTPTAGESHQATVRLPINVGGGDNQDLSREFHVLETKFRIQTIISDLLNDEAKKTLPDMQVNRSSIVKKNSRIQSTLNTDESINTNGKPNNICKLVNLK